MSKTKNKFMERGDIILRPLETEDAEFIAKTINHKEVRDYLGRAPKPINYKQQEEYIQELSEDEDRAHFIIEHKGVDVGHIFVENLENDYGRSHVGYFVHPQHHGKGIASKSLKMLVRYTFETLNRHKIRGGYLEGNPASRRVMEKAGFKEEGTERHYKYVDGEWKNVIWMSILEGEYYD